MTRIWISDRGEREPGPAQRQVGERGEAPARERDAREDEEIGESDDHLALLIGTAVQATTPTNVELLNSGPDPTDNPDWKGSQGGSHDTEVSKP